MSAKRSLRLGAGAGFSGDRIEPAVELATAIDLDYLIFECLGERTVALAQQVRQSDPDGGYDPLLVARLRAVLPVCARKKIRVVTNMGAANPAVAARVAAGVARELGLGGLRIAAVTGDDVLAAVRDRDFALDVGGTVRELGRSLLSANAYIGARPIVEALEQGADLVITGRAADPVLYLAPQIHEFGWAWDDWDRLGRGTLVGHLLECAGQLSGGYFADPGYKDVSNLASLGFPYCEVDAEGNARAGKAPGTGGLISEATCKEQLLYEIHDPSAYLQPDVVADFSGVEFNQIRPDSVAIGGGAGRPKSGMLKVSVGYEDCFMGEGQISYAGAGALERGRLAIEIVRERLRRIDIDCSELRFDLIGADAILGGASGRGEPFEVRVRVAGRTRSDWDAVRIGNEVEALYLNGPAGGGGATKFVRPVVSIASTLVPETIVSPNVEMVVA